jgi:hypothetical protein
MATVVVVGQDQMGSGDRELGQKILGTFLRKARRLRDLEAIVMFNTGVRLLEEGSPWLADLVALEELGVELMPCGTCLEHLGTKLAHGRPSDMDSILRELDRALKVVTL